MNNNFKLKVIFFCSLLFYAVFYYQITNAQVTTTNVNKVNTVISNDKHENFLVDKEKEMLEKTINILDKTNTSLTQQWTPMSVLLSITAGLFALVTLLWAGVFAWGYLIFRKIASDKKRMATEMKKLSIEGKKVLEEINISGQKIVAEFKEKSKTLPELEKELIEFKEKANQAIERLEDKTIGTISGSNHLVYGETNFDNSLFGNRTGVGYTFGSMSNGLNNLKVCSKCGNVFKEEDSVSLHVLPMKNYLYLDNDLCKKCKEEVDK